MRRIHLKHSVLCLAFLVMCQISYHMGKYSAGLEGDRAQNPAAGEKYKSVCPGLKPSMEYEMARRKVRRDVNEFWHHIRHVLNILMAHKVELPTIKAREILENSRHRWNTIMADLYELKVADGFEHWRVSEHARLGVLVQNRIRRNQNENCDHDVQVHVCNMDNEFCGYGCMIHLATFCAIKSVGHNRKMMYGDNWDLLGANILHLLKPLNVCDITDPGAKFITEAPKNVPFNMLRKPVPDFAPPAIPSDMANDLITLMAFPQVWWVGQFVDYVFHVKEGLVSLEKLPPRFMGIQIRRSDKVILEARAHSCQEYMEHAIAFNEGLGLGRKEEIKDIFLATDDPNAIQECVLSYPDYRFHYNKTNVDLNRSKSGRYRQNALEGFLHDVSALAKSEYLVCTLSSNICRLAYEMMHLRFYDADERFQSLDDIWYFSGQNEPLQEVILPHESQNPQELNLQVGDLISIQGNHWDGYSKGINRRTQRDGLYPEYKTRIKHKLVDFF